MHYRRRYYLNALFDLELGGFPVDSVRRAAAEMTALFLPLVREGDSILLDVEVPTDHYAYLRGCGFGTPDIAAAGENGPGGVLHRQVVWGWNREAAARLALGDGDEMPPFDAVRRVNDRRFCSEAGERCGFGVPGSRFCGSRESFDHAAADLAATFPLVIKPAFGGAGFGLRVVSDADGLSREQARIDTYLLHGGLVLEPWCERTADLSVSIDINPDGSRGTATFQRQFVNTYGAFYGMYCAPDDPEIAPWKTELDRAVRLLADEAVRSGYFGPFGIDSFVYLDRTSTGERLAAGIEVNARFTMGMLAQELRRRVAPDGHTLLRFLGRKRCRLPETAGGWLKACGCELAFDPQRGSGIIAISPLRIRHRSEWQQPQRSAFLIVGPSLCEIERLDDALRRRFSPPADS